MADWLLTKPIVDRLQARLASDLPGELADLRSGFTADETMAAADPRAVYGFVPPDGLLTDLPVVGLAEMGSRVYDDTGASATAEHRIGAVAFVSSPDQRLLAVALRCYATAMTRVLLSGGRVDNPYYFGVTVDEIGWGPTLEGPEDPRVVSSFVVAVGNFRREELP